MKLSIWQQFSSNHSGTYFVVGVFNSIDAAQYAESEIKTLLRDIDAWHREHPQAAQQNDGHPFPPELNAAEKYHVEWPRAIDWSCWASYYMENHPGLPNFDPTVSAASCIEDSVKVAQNVAFATNPDQTWMTMQPFKGLLEYFGAKTVGFDIDHSIGWENWFFRITCIAPNGFNPEKLKYVPDNLDLKALTIQQNERTFIYEFQITTHNQVGSLVAILKSNGCTIIQIDLIEKSE